MSRQADRAAGGATTRFHDAFRNEQQALVGAVVGVAEPGDRARYASVLLSRLMFVYFVQKRGFLDGAPRYLVNRLKRGRSRARTFYRLFEPHELETKSAGLDVPDEALERVFAFFDRYEWTLDDGPPASAWHVNPDVIGHVFERSVNRRQMGAYYTGDDIAEYIARNTIIPFLLERVAARCPDAFRPDRAWRLLSDDPDRYIFDAQCHGPDSPAPPDIAAGREFVISRERCPELRQRLRAGEVSYANDLITNNLDLRRLAKDVIRTCDDAALRAFWEALQAVTVLDPTCGAGAFLFAALDVLEPLYDACLDRMPASMMPLPDRRLAVLNSILANNLYGVDVMGEAVEVCKLRLLLRVLAQARTVADLESLPDIDCNVRPGDALAGAYHPKNGGGFDVVIGNPPYVEYDNEEHDYRHDGFSTASCGNLYALVVERGFALLGPGGRSGMIVPHSAFCTDRMAPLMSLFGGRQATWVSTYDIRPSKLFAGVDQRLAIYLTAPAPRPQTFATRYHRWHEPARPYLFRSLRYVDVSDIHYPNAVAKVGSETELRLLKKLRGRSPLGGDLGGRRTVYYHNAPRYWVRAMTFAPYFRNERDGEKLSAQVKSLPVHTAADAGAVAAALNSSLFYWWFVAFSDSRHLNRREIDAFPLDLARMRAADRRALAGLCARLMKDYRRHAVRKECRYKTTGRVVYDEYYPRHSKAIIDEIDRTLARHLGLDDYELDFVLNFDLKYRLDRDELDH